MFCDNCGKSNASGVIKCAYCGSDMPKITESTGFSDILTYKPAMMTDGISSSGVADSVDNEEKKASEEMKKDSNSVGNKIGIVAIIISLLVLLFSVYINNVADKKLEKFQEETEMQLIELDEKIKELDGGTTNN